MNQPLRASVYFIALFCLATSALATTITDTTSNFTGTVGVNGTVWANGVPLCQSDGTNCPVIGNATSGTTAMWLTNLTASGIGNWSSDKSGYITFAVLNGQNNLSLGQISANIGNWSADKSSYVTFSV